jgi:hypothetical protein
VHRVAGVPVESLPKKDDGEEEVKVAIERE